jgi:hypothetical protein
MSTPDNLNVLYDHDAIKAFFAQITLKEHASRGHFVLYELSGGRFSATVSPVATQEEAAQIVRALRTVLQFIESNKNKPHVGS